MSLLSFEFTLLKSARVPAKAYQAQDLRELAQFAFERERVRRRVELTLDLTGPARIHTLNRRFRGVDRETDVISFRNDMDPSFLSGDIAINVQQAAVQAKRMKHSLQREVRLLLIHGILHLLDYTDYEPRPRRRMFKRQNHLLRAWETRS